MITSAERCSLFVSGWADSLKSSPLHGFLVLRRARESNLSPDLLVDVFLVLQTLDQGFDGLLVLVVGAGGGQLHFFECGVEVSFGASQPRVFIVDQPVAGIFLDVGAEDIESLLLLALRLQLPSVNVCLERAG